MWDSNATTSKKIVTTFIHHFNLFSDMKFLLLSFSFFYCSSFLFGQSISKRQTVYLELGGNGLFTSVNYDFQLTKKPGLGIRAGIGFYSLDPFVLTIPVGVNYLFELQQNKSYMELGLGATWTKENVSLYLEPDLCKKRTNFGNYFPTIGYRKHTKKSFMWRMSLTPLINQNGFQPFFGGSFGKLF